MGAFSIHHPPTSGYTVFLDGYNIIKKSRQWNRLPLADGRQRLIASAASARWSFPVRQVTIVFDGPAAGSARLSERVLVKFATPSADAFIRDAIHRAEHPQRYALISSDGELQRTARSHGTRYFPAEWFLERATPSPAPAGAALSSRQSSARRTNATRTSHPDLAKRDLPAATARHITEELARRWLGPTKK